MALKSTIFKASLGVADLDRHYYADHRLTLARHPSETDERMMVRLLAFALFADDRLTFGRGLSSEDEPALWLKDDTGRIDLWIEVGLPDPVLLRRAAGRAERVVVIAYGGRAANIWWGKNEKALRGQEKLTVWQLDPEASAGLAAMSRQGMDIHCTIQDGLVTLADGNQSLSVAPRRLK